MLLFPAAIDSARYQHKLKTNGVRLVFVLENLDGSPESVILESLFEDIAEYYSKNLARGVTKGMRENAFHCLHTGGIPPLGYDIDPTTKRLFVNAEEAETVRLIYKMCHDGHGYKQIIAHLNALGRKTKLGNPFGKNSIHDLLVNEKYRGTYVFATRGANATITPMRMKMSFVSTTEYPPSSNRPFSMPCKRK